MTPNIFSPEKPVSPHAPTPIPHPPGPNEPAIPSPEHHIQANFHPPEPSAVKPLSATTSQDPVPVVKVLSTRGVEYAMMTLTLWIVASTLAWVILNLINGSASYDYLVVPVSALLVCVPVFGLLFIRLRKGELDDPSLRLEPSKRRWSQLTQLLAFLVCLVNLIVFVYMVMQSFSSNKDGPSIGKAALNALVILIIAGGALAYYWFDEHKAIKG